MKFIFPCAMCTFEDLYLLAICNHSLQNFAFTTIMIYWVHLHTSWRTIILLGIIFLKSTKFCIAKENHFCVFQWMTVLLNAVIPHLFLTFSVTVWNYDSTERIVATTNTEWMEVSVAIPCGHVIKIQALGSLPIFMTAVWTSTPHIHLSSPFLYLSDHPALHYPPKPSWLCLLSRPW